jgi:hypothetical protein
MSAWVLPQFAAPTEFEKPLTTAVTMSLKMDMRFWLEQAGPRTTISAYRYRNGKHLALQRLLDAW